jgi:hypothetical protein
MSELVPRERIEAIVGSPRQQSRHMARAVSAEQTVYILHSRDCLDSGIDLRRCDFSRALDMGIDEDRWPQDLCVEAAIERGYLVPGPLRSPSSSPTQLGETT